MQPRFNVEREKHNVLFYKEYTNDKCVFQFHSQIELYFVESGEMDFLVNGHHRTLAAGEMSVALPYDSHAYKTPEKSTSSVLIIPLYLCEAFIDTIKGKVSSSPFITDSDRVKKIKLLVSELNREGINEIERNGYIQVILGIILDSIFTDLASYSATHAKNCEDISLASQILLYVNQNFKSDISPSSISSHFGYSQSYISKFFKAKFNVTLVRYLTVIRLKNAVMLLHESKNSVTYCALESGFSSMRTFYRAFSEEFSCSPKEYFSRYTKQTP